MPFIDKSLIKKGLRMYSDQPAPGWVPPSRAREAAAEERLIEIECERMDLARRLAKVQASLEAYRKARPS